jgi:hypothetical protein
MTLLDLGMQLWHALVIKRHFTAHQDIENDAETPNVDFRPCVLLGLQEFGCSKVQTSAEGLQLTSRGEQIAQPKVNNLDVTSLANQDILDLQVAVDNTVPVAVVERTGDLPGKLASLLFLETAM